MACRVKVESKNPIAHRIPRSLPMKLRLDSPVGVDYPWHGDERLRRRPCQRDQKSRETNQIQPKKRLSSKRKRHDGIEKNCDRNESCRPRVLTCVPRLRDHQQGAHTNQNLQRYLVTRGGGPSQRQE